MIDRIKQVMEYYEETPAGFAEKIGVNRSNLTHVFTGRNQPSLDFAKKVLVAFPEVSTEWLIMGVGKMIKDPEELMPAKREFIQTELFGVEDEPIASKDVEKEVSAATFGKNVDEMEASVDNPLENVKSDETAVPSSEGAKNTDTEYVKPIEQPVITVSESNIPQPAVPQPEKSDSRMVGHEEAKQAPMHLNSQSKEKSVTSSVEKPIVVQTEKASVPKEKKIEKIIFFYDDDTFKVYHP